MHALVLNAVFQLFLGISHHGITDLIKGVDRHCTEVGYPEVIPHVIL